MSAEAASAREHPPCTGARLCRHCAAAHMGVSVDLFDEKVRPALPKVKIGARVGFLRADVDSWLLAQREAPSAVLGNPASSSVAVSTPTPSPSKGARGSVARRASEIEAELRASLQSDGTRPIGRQRSRLRLVPE